MNIRWTEKASADLLGIYRYIAERSEVYAEAVYARILARPQQLLRIPRSGSIVPEYDREDIREVLVHSFRIIYLTLPTEVRILTVIHGARRLPVEPPETE